MTNRPVIPTATAGLHVVILLSIAQFMADALLWRRILEGSP